MWRQWSGFDKFRVVCCIFGLPATVLATILFVMGHQWSHAAIQAFLVFSLGYTLYKLASQGRGKSSTPTVLSGVILAVIVLSIGGFFGYEHFVKRGPPTVDASDNSFTVSVLPSWGTANVPHSPAFVLLMNAADSRESMVVTVAPDTSTLQEAGTSASDNAVNQFKAVIDPDGGVQPTTVDGEAALRWSLALPLNAKGIVLHHCQEYIVLHRKVEYTILFAGDIDEYARNHADFDAVMRSWKWSTS